MLQRTFFTLAMLLLGACMIMHDHGPYMGTATFRWSIEESFDPTLCPIHRASAMQIELYDSRGAFLSQLEPPCTAFETTISLDEGWYWASMHLGDVSGRPVSTTANMGSFEIIGGTDILLDADFPVDSFY